MRTTIAVLLLPLLPCGCASAPEPPPRAPAAAGRGVLRFDAVPSDAGVAVAQQPEWRLDDKFVFRRGGIKIETRVVAADAQGYRLRDEKAGVDLLYARDLAELGQELPGRPEFAIWIAPGDPREHWPLFVGKRWEAELALTAPGEIARRIAVSYECDAHESIKVPAGDLRCFRIWRRTRSADAAGPTETVAVHWYSPEVGHFVRRLENGVMLELESWSRAR